MSPLKAREYDPLNDRSENPFCPAKLEMPSKQFKAIT
jgi:hypothetical protein